MRLGDVDGFLGDRLADADVLALGQLGQPLEAVLLGVVHDAGHRAHDQVRVLADAGLAGEHHRVRAVEDRVGHVGGLRAGGPGVLHHRLEHLGGHDHRLAGLAAHLHRALLDDRDLLERQLDAEVAAGHHHPVEGLHDAREVLHGLGLLHLGQDRDPPTDLVHDRVHVLDIGRTAHERQEDHVDADAQRPAQVVLVLLRQRRHAHGHPGQVDALVVADRAALEHPGAHPGSVDLDHLELDLAVVDQHGVPGVAVVGQALVRGAALRHVAEDVLGRDRELSPIVQEDRAVGEPAEPDLGALQVGDDAHTAVELLGRTAHVGVGLRMHGVLAMGHVQAGDVHARLDELLDLLV